MWSGEPGFQILRIESRVRPGDGNDGDVDIRKDVSRGAKNDRRTQQENKDRNNNERIWALKSSSDYPHGRIFAWLRRSLEDST